MGNGIYRGAAFDLADVVRGARAGGNFGIDEADGAADQRISRTNCGRQDR
jgi:hypothetical protein